MSKHIFGPVPSRRLGRSLGVDLVPLKTCSYDCIYCQLGNTTCRTTERKEWVPLDGVLEEIGPLGNQGRSCRTGQMRQSRRTGSCPLEHPESRSP